MRLRPNIIPSLSSPSSNLSTVSVLLDLSCLSYFACICIHPYTPLQAIIVDSSHCPAPLNSAIPDLRPRKLRRNTSPSIQIPCPALSISSISISDNSSSSASTTTNRVLRSFSRGCSCLSFCHFASAPFSTNLSHDLRCFKDG